MKNNEIDLLIKALDNIDNDSIMDLTTYKIKEINLNILRELSLPINTIQIYMRKLDGYKYVDEIKDIVIGSFIKWIPITNASYLPLNIGGIICSIKIENNGPIITCKNFMHKYYQLKIDECLVFQKLSKQNLVLLSALDHLHKT